MKVCIVGATGVVGRILLDVLKESNFKSNEIELFASKKSLGTQIWFKDKYLTVKNEIAEFGQKNDVAILCVDKEVSKQMTPILLNKGMYVIDCSTAYRMDKEVPLIAVSVNDENIKNHRLISNPNCVVMQVIIPLMMIQKKYKINMINLVSFQSVSGSGKRGIDDLDNNTALFYPYKIKETCIPIVGEIQENNYTSEEEKIRNEIRKILDNYELKINATCVRVPVKRCHAISLSLELDKEVSAKQIQDLISKNKMCKYLDIPNGIEAKDNDLIYLGRVRNDLDNPKIIHMYIVGDNLRRGAASNAFWILKELCEKNKML